MIIMITQSVSSSLMILIGSLLSFSFLGTWRAIVGQSSAPCDWNQTGKPSIQYARNFHFC